MRGEDKWSDWSINARLDIHSYDCQKKRMSHICILLKQSADMHPGFGYKENWNLSTLLGCNKITTNRRHEQKMIFEADKELTKDNLRFSRTNFFYYQLGHYRSCCCLQFQSYPKSDTAGIPINVDSAIHECGDPRGPSATVDFITFSCKFYGLRAAMITAGPRQCLSCDVIDRRSRVELNVDCF